MMSRIVTLTGPSGVGKGYIKQRIKSYFGASEVPVYTTRPRRAAHEDEYRIIINENDFQAMADKSQLCFVNDLFGHRYGFGVSELDQLKQDGNHIIEIHIDNAALFRRMFPHARMIALTADPSRILAARLRARGETTQSLSRRLGAAAEEMKKIARDVKLFDLIYIIDEDTQAEVEGYMKSYLEDYYVIPCRNSRT